MIMLCVRLCVNGTQIVHFYPIQDKDGVAETRLVVWLAINFQTIVSETPRRQQLSRSTPVLAIYYPTFYPPSLCTFYSNPSQTQTTMTRLCSIRPTPSSELLLLAEFQLSLLCFSTVLYYHSKRVVVTHLRFD